MKNIYLIFPNPKDVYTYLRFRCTKDELNNELISEELIEPNIHYSDLYWVIFENGIMIQG
jgi:hypothetical protein